MYAIFYNYFYERVIAPVQTFFNRGLRPFLRLTYTNKPSPAPIIISPTEKYIQKQTTRFLQTFEKSDTNFNENIDTVFYSKKQLDELLKDETNYLEPKWRANILFENTPRGNIIMYYDAFKQGFAYYTDQNGIPYPILNAVAMKYVMVFRCRDFFIDEHILPEKTSSGITASYAEEDRVAKEKKRESMTPVVSEKEKGMDSKHAFVKFKSYNSVSTKANGYTPKSSENVSAKSKEEQTVSPKMTNKHISLGKTCNFSFIQKRVAKTPNVESKLLPKPCLSYADYKRKSSNSKETS